MKNELKKYTKEDSNKKEKTISLRIDQDTYKFLKKNNIDVSKYLRDSLKKLMQTSVIILLFLSACAKKELSQTHIEDHEMQMIFNEFKMEAEKRGISIDDLDLTIKTASNEEMKEFGADVFDLGICKFENKTQVDLNQYKEYTHKTILLKDSSWSFLNYNNKRILLFHELGHCTLHQDHRGPSYDIPQSLMTKTIVPFDNTQKEKYIMDNWNQMLNELFYQ